MFHQINNIYNDLLDTNINIQTISENLSPKTKDTILKISSLSDNNNNALYRKNIRENMLVDQFWADKYIKYYNMNPIFTHFDCIGENVINMPLGLFMHYFNAIFDVRFAYWTVEVSALLFAVVCLG